MSQRVTVLRTVGPKLAKTWQSDGTIRNYDLAKHFRAASLEIDGIEELLELLEKLTNDAQVCLIRGQLKASASTLVERNLDTFGDGPSHLFLLDVDGFAMEPGD